MHNKSFTVDNQITIIGGRNIADEYFGAREDAKFGDLDVIGIGGVVQEVSEMFDSYWNHERAAPIAAFAKMPEDPAAQLKLLRERLEESRQSIMVTKYAEAVTDTVLEYVEIDTSEFIWAPYTLAVDSPDKTYKKKAAEVASITTPLRESLLSAKSEIIIISPYFVPRKTGIEALSEMQRNGVNVTVITNSLAANNQASVHGGYAPSRKPLLKAGVRIHEVRDDADVSGSEFVAASGAKATLHTKAFIVDRREVFIGSFNFDPRSANINSELGVIIRSPELAEDFAERIKSAIPGQTFEVFLNEKGKLRWRGLENGQEVIFDKEPHTTWWQRFVAGFMRILPIRGQL
jgi:putative cardiolipin synthase